MPLERTRLKVFQRKVLYFDGVDDFVKCGSADDLRINHLNNMLTFEVGIKWLGNPDDGTLSRIGGFQGHFGDYALFMHYTGTVVFEVDGQHNNILYASGVEKNEWSVVTAIFNESIMAVYINGSLRNSKTPEYYPPDEGTAPLRFGNKENVFFHGYIGYARIYNRVLSESEIKHNYLYPDNPVRGGLVLWLHWDSIDEEEGIWYDKSGYENHGTIHGATPIPFNRPAFRSLEPLRNLELLR